MIGHPRLRSLVDMLRFYAAPFFHAVTFFEYANSWQMLAGKVKGESDAERRAEFVRYAGLFAGAVQVLPVNDTLKHLAYDIAHPHKGQTDETLNDLVGKCQEYLDAELEKMVFLCIPAS